jgi:glycerol uptake facilitator protein
MTDVPSEAPRGCVRGQAPPVAGAMLRPSARPAAGTVPAAGRIVVGETVGTFLLMAFGFASSAVSTLFDSYHGLMPVAVAWGAGVVVAVYATRSLSGAHLNPAVSVAFMALGHSRWRDLPAYCLGQIVGAFFGAAVVYALFSPSIAAFEATHGLTRGEPGSERTAAIFAVFFPNPGEPLAVVTVATAVTAEALATFLLVTVVLAFADRANRGRPPVALAPLVVGLTVMLLIAVVSPLTQTGINPARDLGPRLFVLLAGWGRTGLAADGAGGLVVYGLAPLAGALAAAAGWRLLRRLLL